VSTKPKTIMRTFKISEISAVDKAAQVPARAVLMKRDDEDPFAKMKPKKGESKADFVARFMASGMDSDKPEKQRLAMAYSMFGEKALTKRQALTTATEGHTHLVYLGDSETPAQAGETSYVDGHFHPWILSKDGTITIGEASGHTHSLAVVSKTIEDPMTDADKIALEKAQKDAADATKRAERAEKVIALTPEQRQHFSKKDPAGQDAFLALSPEARQSETATAIAKAAETDPIVFTSADGTAFRKSDDPRLVTMAKQRDADRAELVKQTNERVAERLTKRATDELSHLPGKVEDKVELLKALDAVPAASKDAVNAILKAADSGLAKSFETRGTSESGATDGTAEAELDKMSKAHAAKTPGMSFAKAYSEVLKTPEGSALYDKYLQERDAQKA
jgi:hypothetical protein